MKKFLLYFLLPVIVLGTVYSMGKSSGKRSAEFDAAVETMTPVIVATDNQPSKEVLPAIAKPANPPRSRNQVQQQMNVDHDQVRQAPRIIGTPGMTNNVNAPAVYDSYPAPVNSVYDRTSNPSQLGLVPLTPLQPVPVYPVPVYPAQTYPALAPQGQSPVQSRAQVYRQVRPAAAKPVVDCDCGKEHH